MMRLFCVLLGACFAAACSAQDVSAPEAPIAIAEAGQEGEMIVTSAFEGLCRLTRDVHVPAPAGGNRSSSRSNGTTITVLGSTSQSLSSVNGNAVVIVSGASVLHLTFPGGELVSVETAASPERIEITITGPDAITCRTAV